MCKKKSLSADIFPLREKGLEKQGGKANIAQRDSLVNRDGTSSLSFQRITRSPHLNCRETSRESRKV